MAVEVGKTCGVAEVAGSSAEVVGWEIIVLVGFSGIRVVVGMSCEVVCTCSVDEDDGIGFSVELTGGMAVDDISMAKEVEDGRVLDDVGTTIPGEKISISPQASSFPFSPSTPPPLSLSLSLSLSVSPSLPLPSSSSSPPPPFSFLFLFPPLAAPTPPPLKNNLAHVCD